MSTKLRQELEKRIVRSFVKAALKAGHRLAVSLERGYDVDEMLLGSTNVKEIMDAAFAGDDAHIFVQPAEGPTVEEGQVVSTGWVYIVMGNDGYDVICDYTTNLEPLMAGPNKISEKYS